MIKWEYTTRLLTIDERISELNKMGAVGWECIQMMDMKASEDKYLYLLKRRLNTEYHPSGLNISTMEGMPPSEL